MVARSKVSRESSSQDADIRVRLQRERHRLTDLIADIEAEGLDAESEAASLGELADASQHQADVASETCERERDLTLLDEFRDGLREVDEALERLAAGAYGYCTRCSLPIGAERLEALPAAPYCKACEEQYETTGALEERPLQPTVGVANDALEFLPDDDEFEPPSWPRAEGLEEGGLAAYGDGELSTVELEDQLGAEGTLEDELAESLVEAALEENDVDEFLDEVTAEAEQARVETVTEEEDEDADAIADLEADLFTTIRRQLGEEEAPGFENGFEADGEAAIRPRQADEFLCASCFQLKLRSQLADPRQRQCVDCVSNGAS